MAASERNPQQVEADENLTKAINQSLRAYGFEDSYILTDYLVIAAQAKLDADGDTNTAYSYLYRDSDLPLHSILGLLAIARARVTYLIESSND